MISGVILKTQVSSSSSGVGLTSVSVLLSVSLSELEEVAKFVILSAFMFNDIGKGPPYVGAVPVRVTEVRFRTHA